MIDYIIIGAGQAGLAMAYELTQLKKKYLVLDANTETGAPWLKRWDSLKLEEKSYLFGCDHCAYAYILHTYLAKKCPFDNLQNAVGAIKEIKPVCVLDFYVHEVWTRWCMGRANTSCTGGLWKSTQR